MLRYIVGGNILKKYTLPKKKRLADNDQFKAILSDGYSARDGLLVLYMKKNDCGYPRLGVSVGKVHGNAVVRNRLKRLLREIFRQSQYQIPEGFDYLLLISNKKGKENQPTFEQLKKSFLSLVEKINK
jgi:ribonuclease P protein component